MPGKSKKEHSAQISNIVMTARDDISLYEESDSSKFNLLDLLDSTRVIADSIRAVRAVGINVQVPTLDDPSVADVMGVIRALKKAGEENIPWNNSKEKEEFNSAIEKIEELVGIFKPQSELIKTEVPTPTTGMYKIDPHLDQLLTTVSKWQQVPLDQTNLASLVNGTEELAGILRKFEIPVNLAVTGDKGEPTHEQVMKNISALEAAGKRIPISSSPLTFFALLSTFNSRVRELKVSDIVEAATKDVSLYSGNGAIEPTFPLLLLNTVDIANSFKEIGIQVPLVARDDKDEFTYEDIKGNVDALKKLGEKISWNNPEEKKKFDSVLEKLEEMTNKVKAEKVQILKTIGNKTKYMLNLLGFDQPNSLLSQKDLVKLVEGTEEIANFIQQLNIDVRMSDEEPTYDSLIHNFDALEKVWKEIPWPLEKDRNHFNRRLFEGMLSTFRERANEFNPQPKVELQKQWVRDAPMFREKNILKVKELVKNPGDSYPELLKNTKEIAKYLKESDIEVELVIPKDENDPTPDEVKENITRLKTAARSRDNPDKHRTSVQKAVLNALGKIEEKVDEIINKSSTLRQ